MAPLINELLTKALERGCLMDDLLVGGAFPGRVRYGRAKRQVCQGGSV